MSRMSSARSTGSVTKTHALSGHRSESSHRAVWQTRGMTISIEPLACGTLTAAVGMFEQGGSDEPVEIPVPAWLIRHPDGLVLFDCGMHSELAAEGEMRDTVSLFFGLGMTEADLVGAQLRERDVDPDSIDVIVLSHLHFDHTGGLAQIPNARVVIQADEWAAGLDGEVAAINSFRREDYELGHDVVTPVGEHDLFGDGRVTCIPTPGHTPGHQSLRVRLDSGEIILCADCAYFERTLDGGPLPGIGHDHEQQARSIATLREMRAGGATLVPGHDPQAFAALPSTMR